MHRGVDGYSRLPVFLHASSNNRGCTMCEPASHARHASHARQTREACRKCEARREALATRET